MQQSFYSVSFKKDTGAVGKNTAPVILFPQSDNHKRHEKSLSVLSVPDR